MKVLQRNPPDLKSLLIVFEKCQIWLPRELQVVYWIDTFNSAFLRNQQNFVIIRFFCNYKNNCHVIASECAVNNSNISYRVVEKKQSHTPQSQVPLALGINWISSFRRISAALFLQSINNFSPNGLSETIALLTHLWWKIHLPDSSSNTSSH